MLSLSSLFVKKKIFKVRNFNFFPFFLQNNENKIVSRSVCYLLNSKCFATRIPVAKLDSIRGNIASYFRFIEVADGRSTIFNLSFNYFIFFFFYFCYFIFLFFFKPFFFFNLKYLFINLFNLIFLLIFVYFICLLNYLFVFIAIGY